MKNEAIFENSYFLRDLTEDDDSSTGMKLKKGVVYMDSAIAQHYRSCEMNVVSQS